MSAGEVATGIPASGITPRRAYLQLLVTVSVWGGTFTVAKQAVADVDPLALGAGRYVVGLMVLLIFVRAQGGLTRPGRRELVLCGVMALAGIVGFNLLTFAGLELALAGDAALIMPTMPAAVTIPLAVVFFGEHFGRWQVVGLLLLIAGEVLVFREAVFGQELDGERLAGVGLFFGAAALWGVYTIAARALSGRLDGVVATTWAVILGLPLLLLVGGVQLGEAVARGPNGGFLLALAYMGGLQVVVGLVWWFQGVEGVGAARAALLNSLVPVVALVVTGVVLGEAVSLERAAGAALVVAGVATAASLGSAPRKRG